MKHGIIAGICTLALAAGLAADQQAPPPTLGAEVRAMYDRIAGFITRSAEMFPVDQYTWQPTPEVRSWARLIGHLTDDNTGTCWAMAGLADAPARVDTPNSAESAANRKTKAELVEGFKQSVALCEKAFASVTDANMMERQGNRSKIGALMYNTSHINEHYGNLVTYMRLKGMVPPSSGGGRGMGGTR